MTELDTLIERARSATVDRRVAERYVRELDRWARPEPPARRWVPWLAAGFAIAAAVIAVLRWPSSTPSVADMPVRIGERVAIVAAPETAYRVVRADAEGTEIAVERGAVTARLWRRETPHRLILSGGGVTATATGTVYSLAVGAAGAVVGVVEGSVEVRGAHGVHVVGAGASWPPVASAGYPEHARILLALPAPALPAGVPDAGAAIEASAPSADAAPDDAIAPPPAAPPSAPPAIKDRWRAARLLRGQGKFSAALAECLSIADARDPVWSPIALVEAVRIELGPLSHPERAVALADRMIRAWPGHTLVSEARELRCRALRQLGRGAECAPGTQP